MRYAFIEAGKANHRVSILCRVLRVSRSGFYAWRHAGESERRQADRRLLVEVRAVFRKHRGRYGSPRIHRELRTEERPVSRKRIARLMREDGLRSRPRRRFRITTISTGEQPPASNLLARSFQVEEPNRVWAGDITYLRLRQGWLYLAVLLDLASRKVVGWSAGPDLSTELALGALERALLLRRPALGLVHHSDQGVQYTSEAYRRRLADHGIVQSMSRRGDCWDNAPVESFFSTLKTELGCSSRVFDSREQAFAELADYIETYYNPIRTHSTLGYLSPSSMKPRVVSAEPGQAQGPRSRSGQGPRPRPRLRLRGALALAALALSCSGPGAQEPQPEPRQPPLVLDAEGRPIAADAGASATDAAKDYPEAPAGDGEVVRRGDGSCWYVEEVRCAPDQPCQPPEPLRVRCPGPEGD